MELSSATPKKDSKSNGSSLFSFSINDRYGPTGYTLADLKFLASVVGSYTGGMIFLQNVFPRLIPSWTNLTRFLGMLSKSKQLEWNSRILSSVNAVLTSCAGYYTIVNDTHFENDIFYYHTKNSQKSLLLFLGYVIYDLGLVLLYSKQFPDRGTIVHHLLFLLLCGTTGHIKLLHGCGLLFTVNEVTTPSLNLRWHLMRLSEVLHVSWPRAELVNMLFMYAGFLFFRIIPNTRVAWKYLQLLLNAKVEEKKADGSASSTQQQAPNSDANNRNKNSKAASLTMTSRERNVMRTLFLFLASATGLNWYWFVLINRKAWELLFPANQVVSRVASESASTLAVNVAKQC